MKKITLYLLFLWGSLHFVFSKDSSVLHSPYFKVILLDSSSMDSNLLAEDSTFKISALDSSSFLFNLDSLNKNPELKDVLRARKILLDSLVKKGMLPEKFLNEKKLLDSIYSDTIYYLTRDTMLEEGIMTSTLSYEAKDSIQIEVERQYIRLFSNSKIEYESMKGEGDLIDFNQANNNVYIYSKLDSSGNYIYRPKITQDGQVYINDSVVSNLNSKKALTFNSNFTQGDMYVFSKVSKKVNDDDVFGSEGWFTTCEYDEPHFSFRSKQTKFRKDKVAVGSSTYLAFEDARIPIPLPFIFFPIQSKYEHGVIFPEIVTVENQGFGIGLREGGYYVKPSEYINFKLLGEIYSYGTWGANFTSEYKKNYVISGRTAISYNNRIQSFPGELYRSNSSTFNVSSSASMDPKLFPTNSFSMSLNFGSTKFNQNKVSTDNANFNYENSTNSSINYSKSFKGSPFNLNVGLTHSQNNTTGIYNLGVPSVTLNMNDIFPLQRIKSQSKAKKYYEKLTFKINTQYNSKTFFYDSAASLNNVLDNYRWGVRYSPVVSLPLPQIFVFRITPGVNYNEVWTDQKTTLGYSNENRALDTTIQKGLFTYRNYSYSLGIATSIYGTSNYSKRYILQGIRHVINPSISFSYSPSTAASTYYTYVRDSLGTTTRTNHFSDALFGTFSETRTATMSFGINSNLEIKVRNRKDTVNYHRKIKLIDNLSASGSYNLIKDTITKRQLSDISLSLVTSAAKKFTININGIWTLYNFDSTGKADYKFAWQSHSRSGISQFSLGRIKSINISTGTSFNMDFNNNTFIKGYSPYDRYTNYHSDQAYLRELEQLRYIPNEYANFNVKFSLNLSYNLQFAEKFDIASQRYTLKVNSHSINLGGSFALTENTQITYQSNITVEEFFKDFEVNTLTIGVTKDIHCWTMSLNIVPIGLSRSLSFIIRPKSGILQDLKIKRDRRFLSNDN